MVRRRLLILMHPLRTGCSTSDPTRYAIKMVNGGPSASGVQWVTTKQKVGSAMARVKWILCPVCEGDGKTVNPDIDSNGLTAEDFREDPDFAENYWSGMYDITCRGCNGHRVVTHERIEELRQHADDRELAAREDGCWDGGVRDWRYG